MDGETLEVLKLIASFLIPVAVVVSGVFINKGIERIKTSLSKEKSWNEAWANKFLRIATDYSDTVLEFVLACTYITKLSRKN